jgi:hypothetical protein
MSKKGIIAFYNQQQMLQDRLLAEKDNLLAEKDKIIQLSEKNSNLEVATVNTKYLRLKGNLNVRCLIEEFEQSDIFKQTRKSMSILPPMGDSSKRPKPPSRQQLWNEAMKDNHFKILLACIMESSPERWDTVGERVRDLYATVSKGVHKHDDTEEILIQHKYLYDYEV